MKGVDINKINKSNKKIKKIKEESEEEFRKLLHKMRILYINEQMSKCSNALYYDGHGIPDIKKYTMCCSVYKIKTWFWQRRGRRKIEKIHKTFIKNYFKCKHKEYETYREQGDGPCQVIEFGKTCLRCGFKFERREHNSNGLFKRNLEDKCINEVFKSS